MHAYIQTPSESGSSGLLRTTPRRFPHLSARFAEAVSANSCSRLVRVQASLPSDLTNVSANSCSSVRVSRDIRQICQHRRQVSRDIPQIQKRCAQVSRDICRNNQADMQISPDICRICRSISHMHATFAHRCLKRHGNKAVPALLGWARWLGLGRWGWMG